LLLNFPLLDEEIHLFHIAYFIVLDKLAAFIGLIGERLLAFIFIDCFGNLIV